MMVQEGTPPTFKRVIVRGNFYKGQFAKDHRAEIRDRERFKRGDPGHPDNEM